MRLQLKFIPASLLSNQLWTQPDVLSLDQDKREAKTAKLLTWIKNKWTDIDGYITIEFDTAINQAKIITQSKTEPAIN